MFEFLRKLLAGSNEGEIKKLMKIVEQINAFEPQTKALTDDQLRGKTAEFRAQLENGKTLDDLLPEAYAVVREATRRVLGKRHFDVQLIGGIVLHQGRIAEMKTGEGKTQTALLPAYLNALTGKGVHIVTVNDYLAKYQGEWMSQVYNFLGMSVGLILHDMPNDQRKRSYAADVTYGTNNEFGFDYLRDNMVIYANQRVQRELNFAIVDEVDSILIDEARTPLIISGRGDKPTEMYAIADRFVKTLKAEVDYTRDEKLKAVNFTEEGAAKAEKHFNVENLSDIANTDLNHYLIQALKANTMMKRDVDYVVREGEVVIVDEFTGRLMTGRRYSDGLHQAIEAKEGVKVARENRTLATITFQNYFRMYSKLSGMTGTAKTEEDEFRGIYNLDVVQIPTNRPMIRVDKNDLLFKSVAAKYNALCDEIVNIHKTGQPILVGTVSVEKSEIISKMLDRRGVKHVVLNAKYHEREAEIVAQAGKEGAVTIATNMAGRGTDILLGGNPEFLARNEMRRMQYTDEVIEEAAGGNENVPEEIKAAREVWNELLSKYKRDTDAAHDRVVKLGGLVILGTERHESRRIDNQLRGRAGRQGDPGSSRFFVSFEDDLMRLFGSDRLKPMVDKLLPDNEGLEHSALSKQIENAQKRVEGRNYDTRKHVLQYDDVMNTQRQVIYGQRRAVLDGVDIHENIMQMIDAIVRDSCTLQIADNADPMDWDVKGLGEYLEHVCLKPGQVQQAFENLTEMTREGMIKQLTQLARDFYAEREAYVKEAGADMREIERVVLLGAVDNRWMDHIDAMDRLREGIGLRAYGQRDPVVEYKTEGYQMFEEMVHLIQEDTLRKLYFFELQRAPERKQVAQPVTTNVDASENAKRPIRVQKKIGRNDPCPCGSGKKYKYCCGKEE